MSPSNSIPGYFSPVSDDYKKQGLVAHSHRVKMAEIAIEDSDWLMVDGWEASQKRFVRTISVLDHFERQLEGRVTGPDGLAKEVKIMLLAGGDLIQSFAVPNVWAAIDVSMFV